MSTVAATQEPDAILWTMGPSSSSAACLSLQELHSCWLLLDRRSLKFCGLGCTDHHMRLMCLVKVRCLHVSTSPCTSKP